MRRLLLLAAVALAGLVGVSSAATSPHVLTFDAASGLDTTRIRVVTSGPCPRETTNMVAVATGHGLPSQGAAIITNNDIDFSRTAPFAVPMSDTMAGFAATNAVGALEGAYVITLRCVDVSSTVTYASFRGSVTFTDAHHWRAPRAPEPLRRAVDQGIIAGRGTSLPGQTTGPATGGDPGTVDASGAPSSADPTSTTEAGNQAAAGSTSSRLLNLALGVAGTGLLVLGISSWRREQTKRKEAVR